MDGKETNIKLRAVVLTLLPLIAGCWTERPSADSAPQGNGAATNRRYADGATLGLKTGQRIVAKPLVVTHTVMDACVAQAANRHTSVHGSTRVAQADSVYTRGSVSMQLERLPPLAEDLGAESAATTESLQRLPGVADAEQGQRLPPIEDDVASTSPPPPNSDLAKDIDRDRNPNSSLSLTPSSRLPVVEESSPRPHEIAGERLSVDAPERLPLNEAEVAKSDAVAEEPTPTLARPQSELTPPVIANDERPARLTPVEPVSPVRLPDLIPARPQTNEGQLSGKVESGKRDELRESVNTARLMTSPAQIAEPTKTDFANRGKDERDFKASEPVVTVLPPAREESLKQHSAKVTEVAPPDVVAETPTASTMVPVVDAKDSPEQPMKMGSQGPNPAIGAVASRADQICKHGMSLARRGATFSARAEFIQSLRLISQALDAENGGNRHSQKLAAGLKALDEADDFSPQGSRLEANLNMRSIIATHRTTILKDADPDTLLPVTAMQAYYSYGQQQIAEACGNEPAASLALFGLGKLYASMTEQPGQFGAMCGPKALAFHQAALLVDGANFRSANELGVLLAKYGQLQPARAALLQSVGTQPMPETWHNLAVVHERLGEGELAKQARYEHQQAVAQASKGLPLYMPNVPIQWMTPAEFSRTNQGLNDGMPVPVASPAGRPMAQAAAPQNQASRPTPTAWNLWGAGGTKIK